MKTTFKKLENKWNFEIERGYNHMIEYLAKDFDLRDGKIYMRKNGFSEFKAGDQVGTYGSISHPSTEYQYAHETWFINLTEEVPTA